VQPRNLDYAPHPSLFSRNHSDSFGAHGFWWKFANFLIYFASSVTFLADCLIFGRKILRFSEKNHKMQLKFACKRNRIYGKFYRDSKFSFRHAPKLGTEAISGRLASLIGLEVPKIRNTIFRLQRIDTSNRPMFGLIQITRDRCSVSFTSFVFSSCNDPRFGYAADVRS
jgi:hypothetical protein